MLKLFIITVSLFSTIPTFAMRAIKPRLMQRGYATMTKENLTQLMKYKGSPEQFASELDTMKKDKEDLDKLQTTLNSNVKNLEWRLKFYDPNYKGRDIIFVGILAMACAPLYVSLDTDMLLSIQPDLASLPMLDLVINNTLSGSLFTWMGHTSFSAAVLLLLSKNKFITQERKNFNDTNNELEKNKKNLAKVQSLLLQELKNKE